MRQAHDTDGWGWVPGEHDPRFDPEDPAPFLRRIDRGGEGGHWWWTGQTDEKGYACYGGQKAHRLAWAVEHGSIPEGHELGNACGWRQCVNPDHWRVQLAHRGRPRRA